MVNLSIPKPKFFWNKYSILRYQQNYNFLKKKINNSKSLDILDIGGHTGDLYEYLKFIEVPLAKINYQILDNDKGALEIARKRGVKTLKIDFNSKKIEKVFNSKKFDIIICTEVLEHLLYPNRIMNSIKKLLKADGICLISIPNENTIFHRLFTLFGMGIDQYVFREGKHLHFPTIKQSRDFVSSHLKINEYAYFIIFEGKGSRLSWAGIFLKLVPDFIWHKLTIIAPNFFARGSIFLCSKKLL
ncbi:MAG: methyltransferase domain-containing protein [Candidatus Roizmanbacteria bacterium]|nr:MAG: methyltransferase domain-containing protein [Candidatus Roizmanbacteria bacterium]